MNLLEKNTSVQAISFRATKHDKVAARTKAEVSSKIFIGENSFSTRSRMPSSSKSFLSLASPRSPIMAIVSMTPPKQKLHDKLSPARTPAKRLPRMPGLWGNASYSSMKVEEEKSVQEEQKSWEFHLVEILGKTSLKHSNNDWTESNGTLETCDETEASEEDSGRGQQASSSLASLSTLSASPQPGRSELHLQLQSPYYRKRREIHGKQQKQQQQQRPQQQHVVPFKRKFIVNTDKGGTVWVCSSATAAPHLELNIVPVENRRYFAAGSSCTHRSTTTTTTATPRKRRGRRTIANRRTLGNTTRCF